MFLVKPFLFLFVVITVLGVLNSKEKECHKKIDDVRGIDKLCQLKM